MAILANIFGFVNIFGVLQNILVLVEFIWIYGLVTTMIWLRDINPLLSSVQLGSQTATFDFGMS
jgi:hypothetical protein